MLVPGVLVLMNVIYAAAAYPAGVLSDSGDRGRVLIAGLAVLIVADLVLATAPGIAGIFVGVALWGLHMGLTQGLLATLVADTVPPELRGTAFGMFNLVSARPARGEHCRRGAVARRRCASDLSGRVGICGRCGRWAPRPALQGNCETGGEEPLKDRSRPQGGTIDARQKGGTALMVNAA
jgi:hypothetical protein